MDHKDPSPGCDLPVASLADAGYSLSGCHVDVCCRPGGGGEGGHTTLVREISKLRLTGI